MPILFMFVGFICVAFIVFLKDVMGCKVKKRSVNSRKQPLIRASGAASGAGPQYVQSDAAEGFSSNNRPRIGSITDQLTATDYEEL
jgi:hypothetical protein